MFNILFLKSEKYWKKYIGSQVLQVEDGQKRCMNVLLQSYILQHYTVSEEGYKATWKMKREKLYYRRKVLKTRLVFEFTTLNPPIIHLKKRTAVKVIVIPSIFFIFLFYGIFENDDYGREKAESNEEYKYLELNWISYIILPITWAL